MWHTSIHIPTTIRASWRRLYIRVEYDGTTSNLLSRQRNSNPKETFGYDKLDRLVSVNTGGNTTMNISYAPNGNILSKTGVGNYEYDGNVRPHAVMEVENRDGSIPLDELQTRYNDFGKVEWLSLQKNGEGVDASFVYGPDEQRWYSKTNQYPSTSREVVYAGDYEKVSDSWTGEPAREFYYLDGNTIVVRENGKYKYFLAFTDNIGSILSVIDENGVKVFDASYDAWGRQTVTRNDIGLLRGYTGHEMIPELEIINMNGRLYDPVLGRFFSPDNYVQMPENSQSFNRYSYCLNNPLKYNDPSGESFALVFAIFSVVSDMAIAAHNGENMLKAGAISALSAAATYGIGEWLGSTGKFSKELLRAGAHGLASGAISAISGNGHDFFSSFVSSAAASGIGSFASGVDMNSGLMLASCTAVGGAVAWAIGGDIILGAMNGLQIGVLNHGAHGGGEDRTPSSVSVTTNKDGDKEIIVTYITPGTMNSRLRNYPREMPLQSVYPEFGILLGARAIVNGVSRLASQLYNNYTTEAHVVMGRCNAPMNVVNRNRPAVINGRKYTGHALDRMQGRGYTPSVVEDIVTNPLIKDKGNGAGAWIRQNDNGRVIINDNGDVITVIPRK